MSYKSETLIGQIKRAREEGGISQRALSAKSGLTQSHISQIERGTLEPGLSSLIDMVRALDMELVVVPKKLLPAVKSILQGTKNESELSPEAGKEALREIARGERLVMKQKSIFGSSADLDRIADSLRLLRHAPLHPTDLVVVRDAVSKLNSYRASKLSPVFLRRVSESLQELRNKVAHGHAEPRQPAYALPDDEDDNA